MTSTCPYCHCALSTPDGDAAPSFCMHCGHRLRDSQPPGARTMSYTPTASGADDEVPFATEGPPKTIGGYRLLRLLGSGGMGAVYEAEAPGSTARVAVKLLSSKLASSPTSVERFKQEGQLASQLAHPRCVFVLAADADAGRPYIVMELMPGNTLKDLVDTNGPLAPELAITHILDAIDGLAEAHRHGMIHRDMKPSNCFMTADGRVKVGDFGLSKSLIGSRDQHLTHSGAFLGTILFASPEQIRGETLDYGSDVYSVCATLYYLLCGQAPYHHESITAALAKAISEDPPPIREKRPEVPQGLEAVVMKGLERNRDRRWQSTDDLRDALLALLPSRQHPARPRSLVGAYALDRIVLAFLTVPVEILRQWVTGNEAHIDIFEVRWVNMLLVLVYFTLGEGIFGATPGKWLLGLRVSRPGQTGPPGLWRALVRSIVFYMMILGLVVFPEECVRWFGPAIGGAIAGFVVIASVAALLAQVRRRWGFRGLHDLASNCHVTQNPLPTRKLRLVIKQPTPLRVLLPPSADALPETLGGYAVRGRVSVEASGEQVWAGEDTALARSVLIWLKPATPDAIAAAEVARPTRVRRLGSGSLAWGGTTFEWTAFAAPLGGPLVDAISPNRPLPWADARVLLEQLIEELRAATADETMPTRLGLDQVWVEPNGRVQLLDCSVASGKTPVATSPFSLLREVASLTLEGRPRTHAGPVLAPLPSHAVPILNTLFTDGGHMRLGELQKQLAETHSHPPEVTSALRAAQLSIQAMLVAVPLGVLFVTAFALAPYLSWWATIRAEQADAAIIALADPETRAKLAARPELAGPLKHPRVVERLKTYRATKRAVAEYRRSFLFKPQRIALEQAEDQLSDDPERAAGYPMPVREAIIWAGATDGTPRSKLERPTGSDATQILAVMLFIPMGMVFVGAVARGGVSMILSGITVVQANGQRATRGQCLLRAVVVWLPLTGLLFAVAWLQFAFPERVFLAAGLWLIAIVMLPVYIVVALRFPTRSPQDRIAGTYLVPA